MIAALIGSIVVFIFSKVLKKGANLESTIERQEALRYVILYSSFFVTIVGFLVFHFMKSESKNKPKTKN